MERSLGLIGYRPGKFVRYIAATTSKLEVCVSGFCYQTSLLAKLEPTAWKKNWQRMPKRRKRKMPVLRSKWMTTLMNRRDLEVRAARAGSLRRRSSSRQRILNRLKQWILSRMGITIRSRPAAGDRDALPKMGSCLSASELSLPGSRKLQLSAKPTEVSRHLHSKCPRPERQLPKNLSFPSRQQTNHPRSGSTPRERSRMVHQWILPFPQRKAAKCLRSLRKNMSNPHRSKSANHHDHHLPTILRSLLTMPRIWRSLRTTTPFSSLMP
jgi:hypothetical protein